MYDTILVPTDGSEHAVRAAEHAVALARTFDATVHVLSVADVQAAGGVFGAGGVDEEFVARLEAVGEEAIDAVTAVAEGAGWGTEVVEGDEGDAQAADSGPDDGGRRIRTALRRGDPAEEILAYAAEIDAELLAMGTHGRTGVSRYVTGSVTERVVREAEAPVLTVRATERSTETAYEEILVPTDGSERAAVAVDHALAIAQTTGARVHAVTVVDADQVAGVADPLRADLVDQLESAGEAATESIAARAQAVGLDAVTAVRAGPPARTLLDYAEEADVDLVTMGTAGRTGVSRYLLGSTTERVVRHAEMPVLAVDARDVEDA